MCILLYYWANKMMMMMNATAHPTTVADGPARPHHDRTVDFSDDKYDKLAADRRKYRQLGIDGGPVYHIT